jgi:Ras-related protein Rab-6A
MRGASSAPQALAAAGGAGSVYVPLSTGSPMAALGAGAGAAAAAPALPASAPLSKYKVVFLGDSGAGKTSLIKTFIYGPGQFEANYSATIGIDFLAKVRAAADFFACTPPSPLRFAFTSPCPRPLLFHPRARQTIFLADRTVRLQIWDSAGQERFRSLIPSYIRDVRAPAPAALPRVPLSGALFRAASAASAGNPSRPPPAAQSSVAIVVYDTTSRPSFVNAGRWIEDVRAERGR